eukprot:4860204-Pleurochrysis_carterae.AAC.1
MKPVSTQPTEASRSTLLNEAQRGLEMTDQHGIRSIQTSVCQAQNLLRPAHLCGEDREEGDVVHANARKGTSPEALLNLPQPLRRVVSFHRMLSHGDLISASLLCRYRERRGFKTSQALICKQHGPNMLHTHTAACMAQIS